MTLDDGSTLDSRQPVIDDPTCRVIHTSLATSTLWWLTVRSLVTPLLDGAQTYDPFALLIGPRSVVELQPDDTIRRRSLRSLLSGGTTNLELLRAAPGEPLPDDYEFAGTIQSQSKVELGTLGLKHGEQGKRWRFLNGNAFYLAQCWPAVRAALIVDTSRSEIGGAELRRVNFFQFGRQRLFDDAVVILPHTHRTEALVRGALDWVQAGRPDYAADSEQAVVAGEEPERGWDPAAPPDPIHYANPVPVQAEFQVSGLVETGRWTDPSALEAARSLLQERYDLRIGIWDLARNATLRDTLLDQTPVSPTPDKAAAVPEGAARRAEHVVATKLEEQAARTHALAAISERLLVLEAAGWSPLEPKPVDPALLFSQALTKAASRQFQGAERPLLWLELTVSKRHASVKAISSIPLGLQKRYEELSVRAYVSDRAEIFQQIAAPDDCLSGPSSWPLLWRGPGGWADATVDWDERARALAERTTQWLATFKELVNACERMFNSGYFAWSREEDRVTHDVTTPQPGNDNASDTESPGRVPPEPTTTLTCGDCHEPQAVPRGALGFECKRCRTTWVRPHCGLCHRPCMVHEEWKTWNCGYCNASQPQSWRPPTGQPLVVGVWSPFREYRLPPARSPVTTTTCTCKACNSTQQVPAAATSFTCSACRRSFRFVDCECGTKRAMVAANVGMWRCNNCGTVHPAPWNGYEAVAICPTTRKPVALKAAAKSGAWKCPHCDSNHRLRTTDPSTAGA